MNKKYVLNLLNQIAGKKVMVIGDIMLDRYWWGSVDRISPEAPVPIVNLENNQSIPGGAANVAANIEGLGAKPILIGAVGLDSDGKELTKILEAGNISTGGIIRHKNFSTTVKTRIVAKHQHIVRIDKESKSEFSDSDQKKIWQKITNNLEGVEIIIVSDYAKGFITEKLIKRLITYKTDNSLKIIVDPKGKSFKKYSGVDIITPNLKEAFQAFEEFSENSDRPNIDTVGEKLLENLELEALVLTKGESGISIYQKQQKAKNFKALARNVFDVTGAGDTVISTLGVALAAKEKLNKAVETANIAAGIVVEEVGTTHITKEKLLKWF